MDLWRFKIQRITSQASLNRISVSFHVVDASTSTSPQQTWNLKWVPLKPTGPVKKKVPKLCILNIIIGTVPLIGVYSSKAVIGNFPPVIGEGFSEMDEF